MLKKYKRTVASFLLVTFLTNIFAPTISWALTSGPTAPEYTSFEPVDTTDMVSLATGDLAYNIPILEVPGPSGGYPLSLSYHAGILPNEESSWVGLGWTLNPGALVRTANSYPDDQIGATRVRKDVNTGGERNTFEIGVGAPTIGFGLSVSEDSNLGTGVGVYAGMGGQIGNFGVNGRVGINSFGESHASFSAGGGTVSVGLESGAGVTVGLSQNIAGGLGSVGVNTNFKTVSMRGSFASLGVDMSSKGVVSSYSVGGASISQVNSKAAAWTKESGGIVIPIPIAQSGLFLNIGYNYFRYYSYESSDVKVIGSLHANKTGGKNRDNWAFDSYALIDPELAPIIKNSDPERQSGGSFPAYDAYNVNAQGLNGSIQPYIFNSGNLFRQNLKNSSGDYLIRYLQSQSFTKPVNFRFKNDFSNAYAYSGGKLSVQPKTVVNDNESPNSILASNEIEKAPPYGGYSAAKDHLAGSKHIEWFTNDQIKQGSAKSFGFVDFQNYDDRALSLYGYNIADQVGGFMITNESGVTYHYALPVYGYGEFSKSFKKGKEIDIYQTNENPEPYAYTWLLTAVTGPDYVDRNDNGLGDGDDWGYWVKFDYGKWTDNYTWRNPGIGTHPDLDSDIEFYSYGLKELYYLNAISTKTHTALFEKEIRADSKGVVNPDVSGEAVDNFSLKKSENAKFGFTVIPGGTEYNESGTPFHFPQFLEYSASTLKLKNIYLIENAELDNISTVQDLISESVVYNHDFVFTAAQPGLSIGVKVHSGEKVLDKHDLNENLINSPMTYRDALTEKSIRIISFEHSYTLQDGIDTLGVPNSFDPEGNMYKTTPDPDIVDNKLGKLTLNELKFIGKGGASGIIPPMKFFYGKNPSYNKDAFDLWGFYKSDFQEDLYNKNDRLGRSVTPVSSKETDSWSLSSIKTSLGSTIGITYESDSYTNAVLVKDIVFQIKDAINLTDNKLKILLHESNYDANLDFKNYFKQDQLLSIFLVGYHIRGNGTLFVGNIQCTSFLEPFWRQAFDFKSENSLIKEVGKDYLIIEDEPLYFQLTTVKEEPVSDSEGRIFALCPGNPNYNSYTSGKVRFSGFPDGVSGGYVSISDGKTESIFGGGLRVKEISLSNLSGINSTTYDYQNGATSYEPFGIMKPIIDVNDIKIVEWNDAFDKFNANLSSTYSKLLRISREVPPPGVIYGQVTVEETIQHAGETVPLKLPGKKVFEFQTFDERMVQRIPLHSNGLREPVNCMNASGTSVPCQYASTGNPATDPSECTDENGNSVPCFAPYPQIYSPLIIDDFSSWLGVLKSTSVFSEDGKLLTKTENGYLHNLENIGQFKNDLKNNFQSQGKISQSFVESRQIRNDNGTTQYKHVFSMKNEYPLVPISQKTTNYKTGIVATSTNLAFDFYTGVPTEVKNVDGYGNTFITKTEPAYLYYPEMGLKVLAANPKDRKHMLTQEAAGYTYKIDPTNNNSKVGLISASVQTWSDGLAVLSEGTQPHIWRKNAAYSFIGDSNMPLTGDGLYPLSNSLPVFNAWAKNDPTPDGWQKSGAVTLYDVRSHALEASDVNENYSATKMSSDNIFTYATAANSRYDQFAFSGAEDNEKNEYYGGGVQRMDGIEVFKANDNDMFTTHTGYKALKLTAISDAAFKYSIATESNSVYHASVWVNSTNGRLLYKINGVTTTAPLPSVSAQAGPWYLVSVNIPVTASGTLEVWCETAGGVCHFDDFRVHPLTAAMTSYVYNEWGELSHILDNNNLYTEFRYDGMGRLKETYKETFQYGAKKKSVTEYHYATGN